MKILTAFLLCAFLLSGCAGKESENLENMSDEMTDMEVETKQELQSSVIDWDIKEISIPEIEQEYEIWLFSDSHLTLCDETESDEVRAYASERKNVFVNEKGMDSSEILSQFIEEANIEKPDLIFFGGDIIDFPSEANVTFLQKQLEKLTIPYVYVMGNHDWTFPWEYMTATGTEQYRPLFEEIHYGNFEQDNLAENNKKLETLEIVSNDYSSVIELKEMVILAVDDSSNQVALEAAENIEYAYSKNKPVILLQHVPFSTENLIVEAKKYWSSPVTLGMQVHGGIAPNEISAGLYSKVRDDQSNIFVILAGHTHFSYEEKMAEQTVEIITDAAYKGKALKLRIHSAQ